MWQILAMIFNVVKTDPEYISELVPCFENFIAFGQEMFVREAPLRDMLVDMCKTILKSEKSEMSEYLSACRILQIYALRSGENVIQVSAFFMIFEVTEYPPSIFLFFEVSSESLNSKYLIFLWGK